MSSPSPEEVYGSLAEIFSTRKSHECLEIEILLPGQGPILRDGSSIGITKKALVKGFIVARKRFMQHLEHAKDGYSLASVEDQTDCAVATEIILLFDCEHTTACNWRKRRMAALINKYITEGPAVQLELLDCFERELGLVTTFVCSPLHRHTKSPTLWQHRLWLMTQRMKLQGSLQEDVFRSTEAMQSFILAEWKIACKAGERHPKNYYAFSYMRQLHSNISKLSKQMLDNTAVSKESVLRHKLAVTLVEPMLKWCLSNPKDVSGWMFLFYLLNHEDPPEKTDMGRLRELAMQRTTHFAVHITAWDGESLWTFVDLMMKRFGSAILPQNPGRSEDWTEITDEKKASATDDMRPMDRRARWKTTMQKATTYYRSYYGHT